MQTTGSNHSEVIDLTPRAAAGRETSKGEARRSCKFVLIEMNDRMHLVFGDISSYRYHANLVDEFCRQRNVAAYWVKTPDLLLVLDPAVVVRGGGHLDLKPDEHKAKFSGSSKSYGGFRLAHLERTLQGDSPLASFDVHIDS